MQLYPKLPKINSIDLKLPIVMIEQIFDQVFVENVMILVYCETDLNAFSDSFSVAV